MKTNKINRRRISQKINKAIKSLIKLRNEVRKYKIALKKLNAKTKENMKKILLNSVVIVAVITAFAACSATRTITTTQTHIKGQDTVVTMTTQTKETYDATIKPKNIL